MEINFINQTDQAKWRHYRRYLQPILVKTLQRLNRSSDVSVSIVLLDSAGIHALNDVYRHVDRSTDVLSFVDGETIDGITQLGDIFINVDAVVEQAGRYGHSIKREFCFLVTHGYLHLCGYDHMTPEDEKVMFGLQEEILHEIAERQR